MRQLYFVICWRKNWFEKTYFNNQDIENLEIKRPGKFDDFHLARKIQINDVFCDNFSHTNKSWLTVLQKKIVLGVLVPFPSQF